MPPDRSVVLNNDAWLSMFREIAVAARRAREARE
jgi:hypothetical protein